MHQPLARGDVVDTERVVRGAHGLQVEIGVVGGACVYQLPACAGAFALQVEAVAHVAQAIGIHPAAVVLHFTDVPQLGIVGWSRPRGNGFAIGSRQGGCRQRVG